MHAFYRDQNQEDRPIVIGCYGIGVSRTLAAIVEQNHDENGIIWPVSVAPYHVHIIVMKADDELQMKLTGEIYNALSKSGVEVIIDDRNERPGVKFKDADLIGIPIQIVVGRDATDGKVEFKERRASEKAILDVDDAIARAKDIVFA